MALPAPYWDTAMHGHDLWTGPTAKSLVLFQKKQVMERFLSDGRVADRASRWGIATAVVPFAPRAFDVDLIRAHLRLIGRAPVGFIGDMDPHGVHVFGALRSGDIDAPNIQGRRLPVEWLGVSDAWLRRVQNATPSLLGRTIRMGWIEREYWEVVKRLAPDVRGLIGDEGFELLESGCKLESDAFSDVMPEVIRAALARMSRSGPPHGARVTSRAKRRSV